MRDLVGEVHEQDAPADYEPGFLTCTTRQAVAGAQAAWAKTARGESEAEAAKRGEQPDAGRLWLAPGPRSSRGDMFDPLD